MLVTLSTLLNDLNIAPNSEEADRAERSLEAATDWVEKYLDRPIQYEEGREEKVQGYGWPEINLRLFPIDSVEKVEVDGSEETEFEVYSDKGTLYLESGWPPARVNRGKYTQYGAARSGRRNVTVTYSGGYVTPGQADGEFSNKETTLPGDIQEAALLVASTMYQQAGSHGRVRRGHVLRAGTWFEQEEYQATIEGLIGHYRDL